MRKSFFSLAVVMSLVFSSCMKHAEDYVPSYGEVLNTWTFNDGSKSYFGNFLADPVLDTTLQSDNTYRFDMTGVERGSGQLLTMAISLADLDFAIKSYQSGISGSNQSTSFFYSGSAVSRSAIYFSTNNDPGAVMTYNISSYNAANKTVTITFSGQVYDTNGKMTNITRGRLTARINII